MKRLIILLSLIVMCLITKAQDLPYRPLSEFNKDTTAFIMYNFMDRKDCYKGKTLKEVTKDLGIPVKDFVPVRMERGAVFGAIYIYIYDDTTVSKLISDKKDYNAIDIFWETPINAQDSQYKRLVGIGWDEAYNYLKDMRIKELRVGISNYSKYYEKYKEKETKSHDPNKRREGDW